MAPQPEERTLYLSIYLLTILTGFPTNLLALHALIRQLRRKATPNCILLLNLTLSDLCFLAFLPFKRRRRPAYAILASLGLWMCSLAHCSIVYVTELQPGSGPANGTSAFASSRDLCYDDFTPSQLRVLLPMRLELGIVLFLVPSLLTSFCYCGFMWVVVSSPHIRRGKKQRAVGLVAATLAVFIVCFTPYNVSHVVGFVQRASPAWRDKALLLSTFNASLAPVIFYFSSSAVQHSCRRFLARLWGVCSLPPLARKVFYRRTEKLTPGQPQEQCNGLGRSQVCCSKL
ncbi:Free fatty acid receptor 3 [Chelonia mydas]|uniref:Free fatty acid receptor 3 n=1 Tax=Chelonia mydas TaxID=8469 RepID=M7B997_CHEMY|nr:Free fatty acid receptor 3 [Chelonia mydas]